MTYPDWFSQTAKPNFEKHLLPLAGQEGLQFLQLGVFTGDASVWLLENVLTGKYCELVDVDTWQGSKEQAHDAMDFDDVYKTYLSKVDKFKNVDVERTSTLNFFTAGSTLLGYDFVYVDADHTTVGVLVDAELAWPWLMPDGILAFDDYLWGSNLPVSQRPQLGIDLFLERHEGEYELLEKDQQVWIKKI